MASSDGAPPEDVRVERRADGWYVSCGGQTRGPYRAQPESVNRREVPVPAWTVGSGPSRQPLTGTAVWERWAAGDQQFMIVHGYYHDQAGDKVYDRSYFATSGHPDVGPGNGA